MVTPKQQQQNSKNKNKKNKDKKEKTKTSKPRIFSYPLDWEVNGINESVDFMATFLSFPKEILRDWLRT